ncbi:MAG: hypothetical protein WC729_22120 [Sphingomonas sp.]|jgi:hypothetical protein|uniref:hypothetical protein n=1 Tax=Sphingomonas sp. TaxID=28214 RepID=UPI00356A5D63
MRLSVEEMDAILLANIDLLKNDADAVALEFDVAEDGDVQGLVLVHRDPAKKSSSFLSLAKTISGFASLPLRIEQGEVPNEEITTIDVEPLHREALLAARAGLAGTRVCEGGGCGTLCLSGGSISLLHEGRSCGTDKRFLLSNSHVFHRSGGTVNAAGEAIGIVSCVFDLEAETTFDAGVAEANERVPPENAFKVFNPEGAPLEISGLRTAQLGMPIAKMGMVSGWTEGRIGSPTITRVEGHNALYPSWKATYRSRAGDSGSPILFEDVDGKWYLVGIHFSSGPRFQSWNNVEISVSRD